MVFGILNLVFAAFGFLGLLGTVALLSAKANSHNPVIQIMHDSPGYAAWTKISIPLGLLSCLALLGGGIGLLCLKSWGRLLSIAQAIYAIFMGIANVVVSAIFLLPPLLEQARTQHGPEAAAAIGGAVGGTIGGCIGLIYPVLLLVFMFRPKVVAAFNPSQPPAM
jgi:hypothetical protein